MLKETRKASGLERVKTSGDWGEKRKIATVAFGSEVTGE